MANKQRTEWEEVIRLIESPNIKLKITICNNHPNLKLCEAQFFSGRKNKPGSKHEDLLKETIDPNDSHSTNHTDKFASRGIITYKVQGVDKYLIVTWAIKSYLKKGRNSMTVNICDYKPDRHNHYEFYKYFHAKEKRKYPGDNIMVYTPYKVFGTINSMAKDAKLSVTFSE